MVNKEKKQKNCKPRNKSLNTVTLETINWLEETPAKLQVQERFLTELNVHPIVQFTANYIPFLNFNIFKWK